MGRLVHTGLVVSRSTFLHFLPLFKNRFHWKTRAVTQAPGRPEGRARLAAALKAVALRQAGASSGASCGASLAQGGVAHAQRQACCEDTRGCPQLPSGALS